MQSSLVEIMKSRPIRYNFVYAFQISGPVDREEIQSALKKICDRHESLRTIYSVKDGALLLQVLRRFAPEVRECEVKLAAGEDLQEAIRKVADQDLQVPFRPECAPPWRVARISLSHDESVLVFIFSHIIFDRWSVGILIWELMDFLCSIRSGLPSLLPPVGMQLLDYVPAMRKRLENLEAQAPMWEKDFAGAMPVKSISGHPNLSESSGIRHLYSGLVAADVVHRLQDHARAHGVSYFSVLYTAFNAAWAKHTGQHDLIGITMTPGRGRPELFNCISCFIESALNRVNVSPGTKFSSQVKNAHSALMKPLISGQHPRVMANKGPRFMVNYQAVPASSIRGLPGTETKFDLSRFLNVATPVKELGLVFNQKPVLNPTSFLEMGASDVTVYFRDIDEGLWIDFWYKADMIFDSPTIPTLFEDFTALLEELSSGFEVCIT